MVDVFTARPVRVGTVFVSPVSTPVEWDTELEVSCTGASGSDDSDGDGDSDLLYAFYVHRVGSRVV
ncbi:hypothetical protein Q8G50_34080, partial [Klebsiella pneumoniae]